MTSRNGLEKVPAWSHKPNYVGSSPTSATIKELWQTWCMRWTENPVNMVRIHEVPH